MKKLVMIAGVISLLSSTLFGYKITVDNKYNGDVKMTIEQALGKNKVVTLPANRPTTVQTDKVAGGLFGRRCIGKLHFEALTGSARGNRNSVQPEGTGAGIRCKDLTGADFVRILGAQDGTLVVQLPPKNFGFVYEIHNETNRQVVAHFESDCYKNAQYLVEPHKTIPIKTGYMGLQCAPKKIFFRFASGDSPRGTFTWRQGQFFSTTKLFVKEDPDTHALVVDMEGVNPYARR